MVNREQRDLAGCLLKKFLACEISNDDFENDYPVRENDDRALGAIYDRLWRFWDDIRTHTLVGKHELEPEARVLFERCIAFLESNLEYQWPPLEFRKLSQGLLRFAGLRRIADRRSEEWTQRVRNIGEWDLWPFIRKEDYENVAHGDDR